MMPKCLTYAQAFPRVHCILLQYTKTLCSILLLTTRKTTSYYPSLTCSAEDSHKLTWQNKSGSTILHETGTNNKTVGAAREMLRRAPMLLSVINKNGETALFYAVRHGKTKIFKYLHDEVTRRIQGPDLRIFLQRDDKSTILHLAILSRNYCKFSFVHFLAL
ncbi:putative ankyrin repeat-containing domain-containing protein [Helianthus annuus]|nr:putative ankyrin repeat-containing domain-containing protein [Helianthus annuus]